MRKRRNPHVGSAVQKHVGELRRSRPGFREAFDKLRLARRLRDLREELGLTQTEVAARAGTQQSAIARLESGRVVPDLNLLAKVARGMGLTLKIDFDRSKDERV
ncbi:MAG: helix-turn-helix domain-containing protein [Myxococcaceae bacterium]